MTPEEHIELLKTEGFNKVYVWDATPGEEDEMHAHEWDTRLVILDGDIEITLDGATKLYKEKEEVDIPHNAAHSAKVGMRGCTYIVAERH